jgi:hypothetical protein
MHVCYWIVGLDTDRPEIALDLRNDDGSLAAETHTIRPDDVTKAHQVAEAYAHSIGVDSVRFDPNGHLPIAKSRGEPTQ